MVARSLSFFVPFGFAAVSLAQNPASAPQTEIDGAPPALAATEATTEDDSPKENSPAATPPPTADAVAAEDDHPAAAPAGDAPDVRCPAGVPCIQAGELAVWPRLRLRSGFRYIQPDAKVPFVGQNDGFFLEQGRIGLEASWKNRVNLRLIIDATSVQSGSGSGQNDPLRPLVSAFRDAYIEYQPNAYFSLLAGQALLPFMAEGAVSRAQMNFTARSIAADGVRAGEGYFVPGLSPDRELGITVGARRAPLGPVFLQYLLTLANGNGQNRSANDNKLPALLARVGGGYEEWVEVGVAAQYNPRTVGELPNLYQETDLEVAGDIRLRAFGFDLLGQMALRQTSFDTVFPAGGDAGTDQALGATAWLVVDEPFGLPMWGVKPGYRFSYYDPRSSDAQDHLMEHTFGIRYDAPGDIPVAFLLDATLLFESAELDSALAGTGQALDNHRVTAILQFDL